MANGELPSHRSLLPRGRTLRASHNREETFADLTVEHGHRRHRDDVFVDFPGDTVAVARTMSCGRGTWMCEDGTC
jgi:hypothetical protein